MARSVYSDIAFCHAMVNRNLFKKSGNLNFVEIQYFITYGVSFSMHASYYANHMEHCIKFAVLI